MKIKAQNRRESSFLDASVMRSLVSMLPKHDDLLWKETPDDLKCDISFAKENLLPYVAEFARLQEIDKTTNVVTAEWSKRCQELEDENDRLRGELIIIADDETDYPRQVAENAIST
ncbi:MAG: hypothetical protein N0E44_18080 [Candidatus Thiodiazotropha lotti]|nr:hypothetical protein [Candidatus Thiodiazotropha lotti]MCW4221793.1 hypothetical protein [Candidatus Thiodiazotropha lotti]